MQDINIGIKYNKLTILEIAFIKNNHKYYLCKCDCGKEKIINLNNLKRNSTKSCGCLRKDNKIKPKGEANFNLLFNSYKSHAISRNLSFDLNKEYFKILTKKNCFYCGVIPSNIKTRKKCNGDYVYNGIDRINNQDGYNINNCVPCCGTCNAMKSNLSLESFINQINNIYKNLNN